MFGIPSNENKNNVVKKALFSYLKGSSHLSPVEKLWSISTFLLGSFALLLVIGMSYTPVHNIISPLVANFTSLKPLTESKKGHEVFGFAPYWTINKLDNVDFSALTTFAYFGVPINPDGTLDRTDQGYRVFKGDKATEIFKKAHKHGTRVVLTLTLMDNPSIDAFMDSPQAQQTTIEEAVTEVKNRGIDGVNVDIEYVGNPGASRRNSFSTFIKNITERMHAEIPGSRVTVSVYASSAQSPKMYDIAAIGNTADGIFMMAYDFAVTGSDQAMPTAPLYGYKEGKYSYDIATAVEDFLKVMPADRLILGVPYYGYNYLIYGNPKVKAETRPGSWRGRPTAQTYSLVKDNVVADREGWDEVGQVGWKAYYVPESDTWRMVFLDDEKSLAIKYDYAKSKNLAGVGMWALGFDNGKTELWTLIKRKFGTKLASTRLLHSTDVN